MTGHWVRVKATDMPYRSGIPVILQQKRKVGWQDSRCAGRGAVKVALYGLAVLVTYKQKLLFALALPLDHPHVNACHHHNGAERDDNEQPQQHGALFILGQAGCGVHWPPGAADTASATGLTSYTAPRLGSGGDTTSHSLDSVMGSCGIWRRYFFSTNSSSSCG